MKLWPHEVYPPCIQYSFEEAKDVPALFAENSYLSEIVFAPLPSMNSIIREKCPDKGIAVIEEFREFVLEYTPHSVASFLGVSYLCLAKGRFDLYDLFLLPCGILSNADQIKEPVAQLFFSYFNGLCETIPPDAFSFAGIYLEFTDPGYQLDSDDKTLVSLYNSGTGLEIFIRPSGEVIAFQNARDPQVIAPSLSAFLTLYIRLRSSRSGGAWVTEGQINKQFEC